MDPHDILDRAVAAVKKLEADPRIQHAEIVGSVRRGKTNVGDLDLLIVTDDPWAFFEGDRHGPRDPKRVAHVFVATPQTYGAVLAFGTGPRQLNAQLRKRASLLGLIYDFNGHREQCFAQFSPFVSLRKPTGVLVATPTEASFFQRLDVPHVPPAYREWLAASDFVDGTLRPTLTTPEPWRSPCRHMGQRVGQLHVGDCDQPIYACKELGCCLPNYGPTENALAAWLVRDEASHYHLCHGCRLRQPTSPGEPSLAHHV